MTNPNRTGCFVFHIRCRVLSLCLACLWADSLTPTCLSAVETSRVQLASFEADITPPIGPGVGIGFIRETKSIEHPLMARGVVLKDAAGTYVLCAVDLTGLCNESYDLFRERIADAARTTPDRVAVQSVHQHTAPCFDAAGRRKLYDDPEVVAHGIEFATTSADRIARAVETAGGSFRRVTHVETNRVRVDRVASNRRVPTADGTLRARGSSTTDAQLQAAPEGVIDPWLRTISFFDDTVPLARLHYYATHPQSFYGDGRISWDVPGIAIQRLQDSTAVPQIYFTGCGGNVGMGKYNNGTREARGALADRLHDAMLRSIGVSDKPDSNHTRQAMTAIRWKTASLNFPLREDAAFIAETQHQILTNRKRPFSQRIKAAMLLAWIERTKNEKAVQLTSMAFADVRIVHLPGEPFVQYQLAAQRHAPDQFVAVAGYGECAMWYIGEDRIYTDRGGYEQTWAFTAPCEKLFTASIQRLVSFAE